MEDSQTYTLFHGTSQKNKTAILSSLKYRPSDSDHEWAGTGVYYFWDCQDEKLSYKNAYKWAKYIKCIDDPAIICNTVIVDDNENVLDLRDPAIQMKFHQFREKLFTDALRRADRQGKMLAGEYTNSERMDCLTINTMADKTDIDLVIKSVYINFTKYKYSYNYSHSEIPNCTIVCLRNQDLIKEWREYHV